MRLTEAFDYLYSKHPKTGHYTHFDYTPYAKLRKEIQAQIKKKDKEKTVKNNIDFHDLFA
jgi:hypothetical protein